MTQPQSARGLETPAASLRAGAPERLTSGYFEDVKLSKAWIRKSERHCLRFLGLGGAAADAVLA